MTTEHEELSEHQKFKELSALATTGTLTPSEWAELKDHLWSCEACSRVNDQYLILASEMPLLAARYRHRQEPGWNDTATRKKFFARVWALKQQGSSELAGRLPVTVQPGLLRRVSWAVLAACLVVGVIGFVVDQLGSRKEASGKHDQFSAEDRFQKLAPGKKSVDELLDVQTKNLSELQNESSQNEQELAKLRSALQAVEGRAKELTATKSATDAQLQDVSKERDTLNGQLRDIEQDYRSVNAELVSLRAEHDEALLRTSTLESRIDGLTAVNRDEERKLKDDEQYLASDRDVRELMGARKLYIADVFDVDSHSHTGDRFGRIFYTQNRSLVFYAFDLEDASDRKNTFQAWGRTDANSGKPLNLGIFYVDSVSNRRWILRFDDGKKLAEIDSVFVTVEPHGGSKSPTSTPFLYALLRKEPNHP